MVTRFTLQQDFGSEVLAFADELARLTEDAGGLSCTYLSDAHRACSASIARAMEDAGLTVRIDGAANVIGVLRSDVAGAPTLVTGSHYDTVRNGGKFDGRLGIIIPVLIAKALGSARVLLPFNLEIVAFSEEEGARFRTSFLASAAYTGRLVESVGDLTDANGETLSHVMERTGTSVAAAIASARDFTDVCGYVEIHIEQGPVLLERNLPLGIVTSIAGSGRYTVNVTGTAGHAGTTPMKMRHDAAAAAAEMILSIEKRCSTQDSLVGTVGQLEIPRGSVNVIAGRCRFTIDVRAATDPVRDAAINDVMTQLNAIAQVRGVQVDIEQTMLVPAAACAPRMIRAIQNAVHESGVNPFDLVSGAGHDAMSLAHVTDIGMLFVRSGNGGISHNPRETVSAADAMLAGQTFLTLLLKAEFIDDRI